MADETCAWTGASGTKYTYYVYKRGISIKEGSDVDYVYAKFNQTGQWAGLFW